ncbi:hypothetical protein AYI69_g875 [Smittium culicis]|uniref:Uncharacterized protein n=1 Tax=Smittium culicis TaxID=133412 RepID=A0A1R1YRV4_9FUNG|nr:hypothetical protein AYI69_g875 [Smittium culicis]
MDRFNSYASDESYPRIILQDKSSPITVPISHTRKQVNRKSSKLLIHRIPEIKPKNYTQLKLLGISLKDNEASKNSSLVTNSTKTDQFSLNDSELSSDIPSFSPISSIRLSRNSFGFDFIYSSRFNSGIVPPKIDTTEISNCENIGPLSSIIPKNQLIINSFNSSNDKKIVLRPISVIQRASYGNFSSNKSKKEWDQILETEFLDSDISENGLNINVSSSTIVADFKVSKVMKQSPKQIILSPELSEASTNSQHFLNITPDFNPNNQLVKYNTLTKTSKEPGEPFLSLPSVHQNNHHTATSTMVEKLNIQGLSKSKLNKATFNNGKKSYFQKQSNLVGNSKVVTKNVKKFPSIKNKNKNQHCIVTFPKLYNDGDNSEKSSNTHSQGIHMIEDVLNPKKDSEIKLLNLKKKSINSIQLLDQNDSHKIEHENVQDQSSVSGLNSSSPKNVYRLSDSIINPALSLDGTQGISLCEEMGLILEPKNSVREKNSEYEKSKLDKFDQFKNPRLIAPIHKTDSTPNLNDSIYMAKLNKSLIIFENNVATSDTRSGYYYISSQTSPTAKKNHGIKSKILPFNKNYSLENTKDSKEDDEKHDSQLALYNKFKSEINPNVKNIVNLIEKSEINDLTNFSSEEGNYPKKLYSPQLNSPSDTHCSELINKDVHFSPKQLNSLTGVFRTLEDLELIDRDVIETKNPDLSISQNSRTLNSKNTINFSNKCVKRSKLIRKSKNKPQKTIIKNKASNKNYIQENKYSIEPSPRISKSEAKYINRNSIRNSIHNNTKPKGCFGSLKALLKLSFSK